MEDTAQKVTKILKILPLMHMKILEYLGHMYDYLGGLEEKPLERQRKFVESIMGLVNYDTSLQEFFLEFIDPYHKFIKITEINQFKSFDEFIRQCLPSTVNYLRKNLSSRSNVHLVNALRCLIAKVAPDINKRSLNNDILKLLHSGEGSDFTITCFETKTIVKVHKLILSARSPVFKSMLANENLREAQTGNMVIVDFPLIIIKKALCHIYGENVKNMIDVDDLISLMDLYIFGEKYDVESLKMEVEDLLLNISMNDLIARCKLIDSYPLINMNFLSRGLICFIANNMKNIKKDKDMWNDLIIDHPNLLQKATVQSIDLDLQNEIKFYDYIKDIDDFESSDNE